MKREDGLLVREMHASREVRAHELPNGIISIATWKWRLNGGASGWNTIATPRVLEGGFTRAELAALAAAFPVVPPAPRHAFKNDRDDEDYCRVHVSGAMSSTFDPESCGKRKDQHPLAAAPEAKGSP